MAIRTLPARRNFRRAKRILPPVLVGLAVVGLWQVGVFHRLLGLKTYTLAYPSDIVRALADDPAELEKNVRITLIEAFSGYAVGSALGVAIAIGLLEIPSAGRAFLPVVGALASMPVIALAPLMVLYFGLGLLSKIAVVVIMTLPPMAVTTYKGISSVHPDLQVLFNSYAAGRVENLRKLRLPWSLPFVFTGLKVNVTLSLIGAIIAEFFASQDGLGNQMHYAVDTFDMSVAWGTMIVAALLGVIWYQLLVAIERLVIPWHASIRSQSI